MGRNKPRGILAGRKLKQHRTANRWSEKKYKYKLNSTTNKSKGMYAMYNRDKGYRKRRTGLQKAGAGVGAHQN